VQHLSPLTERLVGGEDHRPFSEMAIVDHMEQNIGSVGAIAKITMRSRALAGQKATTAWNFHTALYY
jgi:hypothetical protein